jgi:hypothetical protein
LVTHAAEDTATVTELADEASPGINAAVGTHQSANSGGVGHGYFNDVANFVGPKYGLPGYKESHTWETDFDLMSPLVFDYRMYRALIRETVADATAMSEEELRTHWMEKLEKEEYDKCPQGHIWFSANEFYAIHKDETVPSFEGPGCKGIVTYFLESGVFTGATIAKHVVDDTRFPTIATKLFDGENQAAATISAAFFQVLPAQHFVTPNIVADFRSTNTFSPARHVTLVFWMQLAPQSEAPNAELFAYGGSNDDMFFRTGFGCTPAAFTQCYFVMVFKSSTKMEYFHTYNDGNFPSMETAFEANKWAHVTMMLTTKNPGHLGDVAEGEGCPCNKNEGDACNAALFLWVNKASISLVDWNDGTNIAYAEEWNQPVHSDIWLTKTYNNAGTSVERRFFVSPPASCASAGTCGSVSANNLLFAFPWHGSYLDGVWFCDFQAIASGAGAFGNGGRRALALDAMYEIMQETAAIACTHDSSGQVVTVTGATGNQPDLANSNP